MTMRTLILSLLVVLAAAAPASAGTITRGDVGGVLAYTYSDSVTNRENRLSLQYVLGDADGQYHFGDPEGVTNGAGANCTVSSATLVKCQDNVSRIVVSLGSGDDRLDIDHVLGADDGVPDPASIDGGTGNDRLEGTDLNDSINGSTGDDDLFGFGGADVLIGSAGADELRGSNDPDSPGDFSDAPDLADEITPGDNNDQAFGDLGADVITDTLGNNTVSGGDGDDQLTTGAGNDTVDGDANNDTIVDSGGTNTLRGGAGADTITAGPGNDTILGAAASTVGDFAGLDDARPRPRLGQRRPQRGGG